MSKWLSDLSDSLRGGASVSAAGSIRIERSRVDAQTLQFRVLQQGATMSRRGFVEALRDGGDLTVGLTESLIAVPYSAYFWECPPVSPATEHRPAEFVVIDSPLLGQIDPDPSPFAEIFRQQTSAIAVFPSLRGDSTLIAPSPARIAKAAHLADLVRHATPELMRALWVAVGSSIVSASSTQSTPLWLSTSGLGVSWTHVRIDTRPKYYAHDRYRSPDA